jgi:hypothetical protein
MILLNNYKLLGSAETCFQQTQPSLLLTPVMMMMITMAMTMIIKIIIALVAIIVLVHVS